MGLIAEWNRTDLSQFVSGGAPDFVSGGGGGALSVVAKPERGNVLRYLPGGGTTVTELFMFSVASGLLVPSTTERRDCNIEIEIDTYVQGPGGYIGCVFLADADAPLHGFIHLLSGAAEWSAILNNGGVSSAGGTGGVGSRHALYDVRGRKPAGAPPEVSSYGHGWNATSSGGFEPRRSGSTSAIRGVVTDFGNNSVLGATWNGISADRIGFAIRSSGGNPPPTSVDILNFRVIDPFSSAGGGGAPPTITFVSPTPGVTIAPTETIVVDVTDPDSVDPSTFLFAAFPSGAVEVVWDGVAGAFAPLFSTSVRVAITDGFRYGLRRDAGWPKGTVEFRARAIDDTGGIAP